MKKYLLIYLLLLLSHCGVAHPGIGLVKDSKGNIYYTDLKQVWRIDKKGIKTVVVKNVHTHELYIDNNDDLYGEHLWYNGEKLNTWGHYVWSLRSNGKLDTVVNPAEGFLDNYSFTRDSAGNMYGVQRFTISRFTKMSPDNTVTVIAEGKFKNIRWMHVTPEGVIYFIDLTDLYKIEKGKTKLLAKNLHARTSVFEYGSLQHHIFGIWLDKTSNVYVAVLGGQVVKKITQEGYVSDVVYSIGTWRPSGGLFDDDGNLWIMENNVANEVRVRKIPKKELSKIPSVSPILNKAKPGLILLTFLLFVTGVIYILVKRRKKKALFHSLLFIFSFPK